MVDQQDLIRVMQEQGVKEYPREACGLVISIGKRYEIVTCRNLAPQDDQFQMCHIDQLAAMERGQIVAVWHTHPETAPTPSMADLAGIEATAVPWFILSVRMREDGTFTFQGPTLTEPSGIETPYTGRPYVSGVLDCWSLVRDYYRREFGIALGDYPRVLEDGTAGNTVFADCYPEQGFRALIDIEPEPGDLFLIQTTGDRPSHIAIYVGQDRILHHCHGRLSRHDIYGGYWAKHTTHHLRHETKC